MPRKPRIEYAGAVYHILNRGNYRQDLFTVFGSAKAFERALFDSCSRFGWRLYAYVIMSNHYHLCLKTEDPNLVIGMQWLQSTFANRFNRFVHKQGHVFQGRYQALLIEDSSSMLRVVNYIHLNPVRAGIGTIETLKEYSNSSFPKFFQRKRPSCLNAADWLHEAGGLKPTLAGMRCYYKSLAFVDEHDPEKRDSLYRELCRGWYIGTRAGKKALLKDIADGLVDNTDQALKGFGKEYAQVLLQDGLNRLSKSENDLACDLKLVPWKIILASWIKQQCGVGNRWFSENLYMGNIYSISKAISNELNQGSRHKKLWRKLVTSKPKA